MCQQIVVWSQEEIERFCRCDIPESLRDPRCLTCEELVGLITDSFPVRTKDELDNHVKPCAICRANMSLLLEAFDPILSGQTRQEDKALVRWQIMESLPHMSSTCLVAIKHKQDRWGARVHL
jgi:hypothetical protein